MAHYLIIGASSGIGREVVNQLISSGHQVTATYNNHNADLDSAVTWHHFNAIDAEPIINWMPDHLDGVVYCPGSIQLKPFHRIHAQQFADDYQLQVSGMIRILQAAYPALKKSSHAAVVMYSTVAVQRGFTFHTLVSASKGAIEGFARALAAEWAPSIRVNVIAPSITDTPLAEGLLNTAEKIDANAQRHPLKRIGTAQDIAKMTTFLLSPDSAWITGEILHVDGGMHSIK
ncbi:MAG TPA: SDR family oxidoreductase [Chitinophagales bacterium]|nr:SDR family oxidoreductase [Chitinophagales bacterium]HNJ89946.1 SDR family oxidoreductase [Chitinophagales bacterium]HNK98974.1 SDR family oxidoreductase [Chitinophagales bacterium]HNM28720.1 SDR family oxidoreductase [Chitinophagales bacterium]